MRNGILFLLTALFLGTCVRGQAQARTEGELVMQVLAALSNKDALGYTRLFPDADLISKIVVRHADTASNDFKAMAYLREHPGDMPAYEQVLDSALMSTFNEVLAEAQKLNIHWPQVLLTRYELEKQRRSPDSIYEQIAPQRFMGYVFIRDPVDNDNYCLTVGDLMQIEGKWYGGMLTHIFEANTKFEYEYQLARYEDARKKGKVFVWKKKEDNDETDEDSSTQEALSKAVEKTIVERKYYTGTFDDETPVQLYIHYLKGTCPDGVCAYEAIFKFGDQDDFTHMSVVKNGDHWVFTEDPGSGVMDLKFANGVYTGTWTSTTDRTGYEVQFSETVPGNKRLRSMDAVFETQSWKKD